MTNYIIIKSINPFEFELSNSFYAYHKEYTLHLIEIILTSKFEFKNNSKLLWDTFSINILDNDNRHSLIKINSLSIVRLLFNYEENKIEVVVDELPYSTGNIFNKIRKNIDIRLDIISSIEDIIQLSLTKSTPIINNIL